MGDVIQNNETIDAIFEDWRDALGDAWTPYRGHVYRVFNFVTTRLRERESELETYGGLEAALEIVAIANCFHDVGIWTDGSLDYLAPSRVRAVDWLKAQGREELIEVVELIIEWHHKMGPYRGDHEVLVESFRLSDQADFTLGLLKGGTSREEFRAVCAAIPNAGFHAILMKQALKWGMRHPLNPAPMFRK